MTISTEDLTLEQIEELLPQLQQQLQEAEKPSIDETVKHLFEREWELVSKCLEQEFEEELEETRKQLFVYNALSNVLNEQIGSDKTGIFLKVAKKCVSEKSFKHTHEFYKTTEDQVVRSIARLSFAVVQFALCKMKPYDFKATLNECKKAASENIDRIYNIYTSLNLLSI